MCILFSLHMSVRIHSKTNVLLSHDLQPLKSFSFLLGTGVGILT